MKNIVRIIFIALVLTSCEKVVELKYKGNQSRIIIEGNITNEAGPYFVRITKSISLPDTGTYPAIDNAIVTISDDAGYNEILTPQQNGMYRTNALIGEEGRTYTLTVQVENEVYTAQSTMPQHVTFDSIKVEQVLFAGDTERNLIPVYKDPITKGNNYRFVLSVNNKLINQHLVLNDEVRNGNVNILKLEINDDDLKLKRGDELSIKMQCIDKKVALFYTTLALMADNGPGGGTAPNNPPSNISNGALGIFSAHTVDMKSVMIP
ncbi:protein of unknown function [Chitinophaga sp. CF118]|uniref:DUF4249 family protein n=1 Tax=Chitinophaga sp. CF118 TaxID=1884367 RepID=UPI0008EAF93E|nr:DUF4249 family protein [Chitinophaga sp. CF118]SFE60772.1 protein of unknown function [Chitinophaga sp. CF118]